MTSLTILQFWDDERENLLQCMVINEALVCQILGQLLRTEEAEQVWHVAGAGMHSVETNRLFLFPVALGSTGCRRWSTRS